MYKKFLTFESYDYVKSLYEDLLDNHYDKIFPNNANRNAAGFKFFSYIYDNLASSNELFDYYNQMYCAVSGSIVDPSRSNNYSILKVKDLNDNCIFGKYYRCCTPCNCDIMKYTKVIKTSIEIPKNSGKYFDKMFLTIGDPCLDESKFPNEIDTNIFKCKNKLLQYGYRINKNGKITKKDGRLIIGILYPAYNNSKNEIQKSVQNCITGEKRFLTSPNKLKYGMGDIFVNLSLINNNDKYSHTEKDFCK